MPGGDDESKEYLIVKTEDIKMVADYMNDSFSNALELDCYSFKALFIDAYVCKLKQSEKGREYLEDCWLLSQTSPNRKELREKFGSKGGDR